MIRINDPVPDMAVDAYQNDDVKKVKLTDFRGKWLVVVFYPADFTFVCPTELEELADHYKEFQKAGAEIVSVSTDTHFVHKAWHDTSPAIKKITFPMLADPTGALSRAFGTYMEDTGLALRGSFIVNPEGKVKAFEVHDLSLGRSAKELLRKLQAAKFVSENNGKVCPASWEPGKKAMTPSLDLVGKI